MTFRKTVLASAVAFMTLGLIVTGFSVAFLVWPRSDARPTHGQTFIPDGP